MIFTILMPALLTDSVKAQKKAEPVCSNYICRLEAWCLEHHP